jgi:hypothetical protein
LVTASTALMSWVLRSVQKRIWACVRPFLIFDSPYEGWNSTHNLMLLNEVQSGVLDLGYDCSNCRVGKYIIASHERLIVNLMEGHCESEKKIGEPNWVEIAKHFGATCLQ